LGELEEVAEIYSSQGEVLLAEVELHIAQGNSDAAFPLLETMPETWKTPQVKAKLGDTMGYIRLDRQEFEEAQTSFKDALMGRAFLEDEIQTRQLSGHLSDYLAAENALSDAQPERVPSLKLLQANAMLFGFERPTEAARLYREAAVDTAADSTVAARALYGAAMVYRQHLILPDSAAFFAVLLEERFPDSPQAYEMRATSDGNLLSFLLDRRGAEQDARFAALSDEELAELTTVKDFFVASSGVAGADVIKVRRRQVYLSRRSNILFPPPELALAAARQARELDQAAAANENSFLPPGPSAADVLDQERELPLGDEGVTGVGRSTDPQTILDEQQAVEETEPVEEEKEEEEKEEEKEEEVKERKRSWEFDLNSPRPSADLRPAPGCGP
jgi:hypothetical protein